MKNYAELKFNEIFYRVNQLWGMVHNFREVTHVGIPLALSAIRQRNQEFLEALISNPQHEKLFVEKQVFIEKQDFIIDQMTDRASKSASISIDAFSIVFGHSILDASLDEFCHISAIADPAGWEFRLRNRQITFGDFRNSIQDRLRNKLLNKYLSELEKKSLLKKCDILYEQCKPGPGWTAMDDYIYDRNKLKEIDDLRHQIVHGLNFEQIKGIDEKLWFLEKTGIHFWTMLNFKYNLKIRYQHLLKNIGKTTC